ncbi:MAG: calcium-translocating P-type ATPase, PMCA-type [Clostridia bacterium]|nr:calcium-translocating P-type ATPase, PMCA-type [Clostridia bacterium]
MSANDVVKNLNTRTKEGLTGTEADQRLLKYGKNVLESSRRISIFKRFMEQLGDYMVIILIIAAMVSLALSIISGEADFFEPAMILLIVVLNATIGVVQESKSEHALEALKKLSAPTVKVLRGGEKQTIESALVVPGDIIFLESGDFVPADARVISSSGLKTDESSLTGESMDVEKSPSVIYDENPALGDMKNMVFANTVVTGGRGTAVVTETGMNTETGKIAGRLIQDDTPATPLQQRLAKTGKTLGIGALIICGIIFLMGILKQIPAFDMFMTSVSLAVAAIPEGLPAIVTVMLSLGVQKMAKKNAIIRKLPAVETLGSASVICSDKTGTLTQNKMTVTEIFGDRKKTAELCALCNNGSGPTEMALIKSASEYGLSKEGLDMAFPRITEIPFSSQRKLMTTVHKIGGGYRVITKGAPFAVLDACSISESEKKTVIDAAEIMAKKALRVLACAYGDFSDIPQNPEKNLTFAGLCGMIDPIRPDAIEAVKVCRRAGIKVVMITGDHEQTAIAIAKEAGIFKTGDLSVTGKVLNTMSDDELARNIHNYSVFARVTPEHKVRIVKAFQARGEVVAMTGDGVNDAPALKNADIGCAMGLSGTDVARGAADMVLTDDNFKTIVEAVREGRGIYSNIKRAAHFLLSSNVGEIITIFIAMLLGWETPLIAVQLLWINLITDSLPAISLAVENPDKEIMGHKPINRRKSLFADGAGFSIVVEGIMIGALALFAFFVGTRIMGNLEIGRTMAFATLGLSQLVHAFNERSDRSVFEIGLFSNKWMIGSFLVCGLMQVLVIAIAPVAGVFGVVPLNRWQWLLVSGLALVPLITIEIEKAFKK